MSHQKINTDQDILDNTEDTQSTVNGRDRILYDSSVFYKGLFGMILCIIPAAILGIVLVKISLDHAKMALDKYSKNPSQYKQSSLNMVKKGKTFAYIGLALFIVQLTGLMIYMSIN